MYKAIIFDVDGTLIDSSAGIMTAVNKVIEKFKLQKLSDKELRSFISVSPIQRAFIDFFDIDVNTAQLCSDEYRKNYLGGDLHNSIVYNGVENLLVFLKNQNFKLGIASFKRQDTLEKILAYFDLDKYFVSICGAGIGNNLTKADILEGCISNLKVKPLEVLFIGDSLSDCLAAQQVGCEFAAVTYGFGFKSATDMQEYSPVLCAESVDNIIEFFKKN